MANSWLSGGDESDHGTTLSTVRPNQLTLGSILWLTTALALLLGYATQLGQDAIRQTITYSIFVLVCGIIVGIIQKDWKNAMFWGGLYAMLAFLAVAGGRLPHPSIALGWGLVGAAAGSCAGTNLPKGFVGGVVACTLIALLAMATVVVVMKQPLTGLIAFDVMTAGFVGFLLKPFTVLLQWFERESRQPRFVLASWLAISVLVGNFLVPILGGVQR